jgi:hypothetical protein
MNINNGEVIMKRAGAFLLALILGACSVDPMEACMKQGLERKLPADGGDRSAYIKAREQVRMECERKLK